MAKMMQSTLFDVFDASASPESLGVRAAVEALASSNGTEARGAVYTRKEVVEFILDLVGYDIGGPLTSFRILEPSFGRGDFLLPIIERLICTWRNRAGHVSNALGELKDAIRGMELHKGTYAATRNKVIIRLKKEGIAAPEAEALADCWLTRGDFLLEQHPAGFDFVVGNPPYVRQELIPAPLVSEYRRRYQTMYDRADIYVPFIERSLSLLADGGVLGFICSDRWMKNRYGGPLREYVARGFHLRAYVDMVGTDAFHSEVSAYPAITVIARASGGPTRIARRPKIEPATLSSVAEEIRSKTLRQGASVREVSDVARGSEPWLLESLDQTSLIRRIEGQFPLLEATGCRVGIGVATGADQVFVGDFASLDVEQDRKLPLVTTRDVKSGEVVWQGQGVINPFTDDGGLVALTEYPRLSRYLHERRAVIAARHCAQKTPENWYRTIDLIRPELARRQKLLIPDIKGTAHVVFETGRYYPHHNLYYVVADSWDLRALQAVLLSNIARLFVTTYSTKMRGGYLRFQAQYLRRIRIPFWKDVSDSLRNELVHAASTLDIEACNRAVAALYRLSQGELSALDGNGG